MRTGLEHRSSVAGDSKSFQRFQDLLALFVRVISTAFRSTEANVLRSSPSPILVAVVEGKLFSFFDSSRREKSDRRDSVVIMSANDSNRDQVMLAGVVYESKKAERGGNLLLYLEEFANSD